MTKEQEYLDKIKQLEEDNAILLAQTSKLIEISKFQWDVIEQMNKEKRRK